MKDLVRLPSVFLLAFILLFLLALSLSLLAAWGSLLPAEWALRGQALAPALARVPQLAQDILPVSVLAALLVLLMRVARKPGSRLLSLLVPPACAFVLLVFGYQALGNLASAWPRGEGQAKAAGSPAGFLAPGMFTRAGSEVVYVESLEAGRATGIVVLGGEGRSGRLSYAARGELQVRPDTVALRLGNAVVEWPARPVYAPLFAGDPVIRPFLADLGTLTQELSRQYAGLKSGFYLSCLGLTVALCGTAVLLRLTRWPLLNACLALLGARGILALFVLLRQDGATQLGKALGGGRILQTLPAAGLLLLGVLLLLVDLLFVPFHRGREGLDRA
jgi:energy-coupling factor transporter transmembrane protein EcfT